MGSIQISDMIIVISLVCGFVGQGFYLKGVFKERISKNAEEIEDIKDEMKRVRFADTCKAMHGGMEARVLRLERVTNGKGLQ